MKNVLVVFTTGFVPYGGLTTVMMNYWRAMDKAGLHFDFACTNDPEKKLLDEIESKGCSYIKLPSRKKVIYYYKALKNIATNYNVAHIHGNSATSILELSALSAVPNRIIHNHNSVTSHPIINLLLKPFFLRSYTQAIACSELAGDWLFGKGKYKILRNAIDVKRFTPSQEQRASTRKMFGISEEELVIGHVGKIIKQKNHTFIIDVFAEFLKLHPKSKLLLIGGGNLEKIINEKIKTLNIEKSVVMAGLRTDIPDMMSAMDAFLFPSLWEGLPLAALEAQAAGLPVFISDVISSEVKISENCHVKSLNDDASSWARFLFQNIAPQKRNFSVRSNADALTKTGYNIRTEADKLRKLYF